ncbi:hypothetical protein BCV72DRAFT_117434 [Rhizopus microsporus var. microsporus]|uniref:Uncharacterized protein n=1 Tax=Rhizopus microsporus var. microsporus TaxID=86635 RepID=A0A1X0R4H5_RHIZD|nr:hypothetical protein BCV72DRAFT_117434 [Rhizopus microsporus var. microsporus]
MNYHVKLFLHLGWEHPNGTPHQLRTGNAACQFVNQHLHKHCKWGQRVDLWIPSRYESITAILLVQKTNFSPSLYKIKRMNTS